MSAGGLTARNVTRGTTVADRLENAASFWAKFKGLMGRSPLRAGEGMWLPDSNGIHMLFMHFPIDVAFLSAPSPGGTRRVLAIRRSLPAWRGVVWLVRHAKGVLELPAGTIEATRTAVGDEIRLETAASTQDASWGRISVR